ncbi:MAG: hypothetical protein LQ338_008271, partial [Usnochroma carphineum]
MSSPNPSITKPTIVFVPGFLHTPAHFGPISELLSKSGYSTITVARPTIGDLAAVSNYRDDVQAVRDVLERLVEYENKEVILAPHSSGAIPACQAVNGLERSVRAQEGKLGGIVHVLFIAPMLLQQGQKAIDALEGSLPSWVTFD